MRKLVLALTCGASLAAAAGCTSPAANNSNSTSNSNLSSARSANTGALPPVSSAHGESPASGAPAATAPGGGGSAAKPGGIDTAVLDAKIERAEAKAKASGASQADKNAAAAALLERGNLYRDAGQPQLYRFALGDYRRALRYQPDLQEARQKMDEIVGIYQSMGRPVPDNGLDPNEK